jgi:hypothetical protein
LIWWENRVTPVRRWISAAISLAAVPCDRPDTAVGTLPGASNANTVGAFPFTTASLVVVDGGKHTGGGNGGDGGVGVGDDTGVQSFSDPIAGGSSSEPFPHTFWKSAHGRYTRTAR